MTFRMRGWARGLLTLSLRAAREGRLLYREAYQLIDVKGETFDRYADRLMQRIVDERR